MSTLEQLATRIVNLSPSMPDDDRRLLAIKEQITWFVDDILKMVKNINETSLPGADRTNRIIELEAKYGIPKTHIL